MDLRAYFDNVRHHLLLEKIAKRVNDRDVMHLLKLILKTSGKKGVPQGGVVSPMLSNVYLNEVDRMLEKARRVTSDRYTHIEYARYADDLVVLVDGYPRHDWLLKAASLRIREELEKLQIEVNEEKSRVVDLAKGESLGFLGFEIRRVRSRRGVWRPDSRPKTAKRTALLKELKDKFRRYESQPVEQVIVEINPSLRGWVNYFAVGNSADCFNYVREWVEKKVRRHLMRARKRRGFGWKRWSKQWLYGELGLFHEYHVRYMSARGAAYSMR